MSRYRYSGYKLKIYDFYRNHLIPALQKKRYTLVYYVGSDGGQSGQAFLDIYNNTELNMIRPVFKAFYNTIMEMANETNGDGPIYWMSAEEDACYENIKNNNWDNNYQSWGFNTFHGFFKTNLGQNVHKNKMYEEFLNNEYVLNESVSKLIRNIQGPSTVFTEYYDIYKDALNDINRGGGAEMYEHFTAMSSSSIDTGLLYENLKEEIIEKTGYSLFEIIPSIQEINYENYYLLDGSVYKKTELPDLYKLIGDNFKSHANREVKDDEFALPNLSGRYLVGRNSEGQGFETSDEALQAFALESFHYFGFKPLDNIIKKYFKSKESSSISPSISNSNLNSERIIKKIIPYIVNYNRRSISIDDKAYFFYIRRL